MIIRSDTSVPESGRPTPEWYMPFAGGFVHAIGAKEPLKRPAL